MSAPRTPSPPKAAGGAAPAIAQPPASLRKEDFTADDDDEMDLPSALGGSMKVPKAPPKPTGIGLSAPAPKPAAGSNAAAPAVPFASKAGPGRRTGGAFGEIDLPSPTAGKVSTPRPAPFALSSAPPRTGAKATRAAIGEDEDLPAVLLGGNVASDTPAGLPARVPDQTPAGLPALSGPGLPARAGGRSASAAELPAPTAGPHAPAAGLPAAKSRSANLPFGEIDLPLLSPEPPVLSAQLPSPRAPSPAPAAPFGKSLPPFSLGSDPPAEVSEDDLLEGSLPPGPGAGGVQRGAGGGVSFGELDLGGDDLGEALLGEAARPASVPALGSPKPGKVASGPPAAARKSDPGAPVEEDMEFGGIPQAAEGREGLPGMASIPSPRAKPEDAALSSTAKPKKASSAGKVIAAVIAVSLLGGASLEVLTPVGAFGRHALLDLLNRDELTALQTGTVDSARKLLSTDTFADANKALAQIDAAHRATPRLTGLLAYGAFAGYIVELRYGRVSHIDAHAKEQLSQVPPEVTNIYADLARAAEAAIESQLPRAKQIVQSLAQREQQNLDVAMLAGEIELLVKEPQKALQSFTRASSLDGGAARSAFGIARAEAALGQQEASNTQAEKVLKQSPHHVGARLLLARSAWSTLRDEAATRSLLAEIISAGPTREAASPVELVEALTAMARVHMARSRLTQAESTLAEALKIDPKAGPALAGMGELLYREGRYTDALARFEAGVQADPEGVAAKIGAAKTKIALERLQEAKEQLKKLRDARPTDIEVVYWLGRAEDALGDKTAAERDYGEAIALGPNKPEVVQAYVALSQLMASQGRPTDARAKLAEAKAALPPSAAIYHAIGDVELVSGRYDEAREEYEAALKSDSEDLASRFKLGVTFRRMNKFDEAQAEFDKVAEQDKEYPGLALERGLLFEASNRTREALDFYQQALAKAPDDPDMMLRVGSAEVVAGQASLAEEVLRKVIGKRPNSAEVNHYLGRALLLKGTNLAEALRYLKRAVEIDPNRAEYHLYVGWAANEAGQPAVAQDELAKALGLDKGLADAYWQIGVMQRKQGAVVDAMKNLQKALELRPSRFEAYATLAECYEDENKIGDAILSWRRAIGADGSRPEWHYRLGKLLGRAGESELREAVTLSEARDARPAWLAQAYFELAEGERMTGKRAEAVQHYRKFIALAKVDSPYRGEAMKWLTAFGAPYDPGAP
ncbi:MAG TPA: tetratricopeptide repeat protein [Polyangiaceae bacterium]|nr:tetratricopeptide repeat protein [Polyangiaceae bacterium]